MKIQDWLDRVGERRAFRGRAVAVTPPVLGDATRFPYGAFSFKARLPKGTSYFIEASTDLQNWSFVEQDTAGGDTIEYIDTQAFKFSYRFYRLLVGDVASLNVTGYATVTLPPGFSMIANPLEGPKNTVGEMFKGWPDGTTLNKFDTRFFRLAENEVKLGKWVNPIEKLIPGEGAIFFNPTSDYKSHSFVGQIMQGNHSMPIPSGFSIRSSLVPHPGSLDELKFPIADGDVIHLFDRDRQQYILHPYEQGKWSDGAPIVSVGESFWVAKTAAGNWSRNLTIKN
jgi:hypothetical protein